MIKTDSTLMTETVLSSFSNLPPTVTERIHKQPECRLLWTVLQRGVEEYMKNAFATSRRGKRLRQEAEDWIMRDDAIWLCSFMNICHILGLDPDALRTGLKRWHANQESLTLKQAA
jgi:hypothetical protein